MISFLHGRVVLWKPPMVNIEVGGVGFEFSIPVLDLPEIKVGAVQLFYTHLQVREDHYNLYGFVSEQQRDIFRFLIKLPKIGTATAFKILCTMPLVDLYLCLSQGNIESLQKLPSIGVRSARLLVGVIQDRIEELAVIGTAIGVDANAINHRDHSNEVIDARAALRSLGYSVREAELAITAVAQGGEDCEHLVALALKNVTKKS